MTTIARISSVFVLLLAACDAPTNVIQIRDAYVGPIAIAIDERYRNDYVLEKQNRIFRLRGVPILCVSNPDILIPRPMLSAIRIHSLAARNPNIGDSLSSLSIGIYGQSMIKPQGTHILWTGVGQADLQKTLEQEFFAGVLYRRLDEYWKSDWPDSVADYVKQTEFHRFVREYCESSNPNVYLEQL